MAKATAAFTATKPESEHSVQHVIVRRLPDGRMSREDAATYLGHKPKTLAEWALRNYGPRAVRVGGRNFYYQRDLDLFIAGETES
jgi:hypothetical protein